MINIRHRLKLVNKHQTGETHCYYAVVVSSCGEVGKWFIRLAVWLWSLSFSCRTTATRGSLHHPAISQLLAAHQVTSRLWADDACWLPACWAAESRLRWEHVCCLGQGLWPLPMYIMSLLPVPRRLCNARHLCVCPSVCLLATLLKNYWTDLRENFTVDVSVDKEELVNFRTYLPPDPDSETF